MKIKTILLQLFLLTSFLGFGQNPLFVDIEKDYSEPGKLSAHINLSNFDNIFSMQFSIAYPGQDLAFIETIAADTSETGEFSSYLDDPATGRIKMLWFDNNAQGLTRPDGERLFTISFDIINDGDHNIYFSDCPLTIEVIQNIDQEIPMTGDVIYECGGVSGNLTMDFDQTCLPENGNGLSNWTVLFTGQQDYATKTFANGLYRMNIPAGTYNVELIPPNNLWTACPVTGAIEVVTGEALELDLVAIPDVSCYDTYVEVTTPFLRRCFESTYYITYGNAGTIIAENAQIEVNLDADLSYISSEITPISQQGNLLTFAVGDLSPGFEGSFRIKVQVGCDSVTLGQTHCTEATIQPDTICDNSGAWSLAHVTSSAVCAGDSVILTVQNIGSNAMTNPMEIWVIEDDVIVFLSEFQLDAGTSVVKKYPANGSTWRIHAGQEVNHPESSKVYAMVEGCDVDGDGDFSIGYATQFITDPMENGTSLSCVQNVGSFDPNDKLAAHSGVGGGHNIEPGQQLDYTIRFQNTGTDTAFNIRIIDTLSQLLDVSQLSIVSASHRYELNIRDGRILDIYFNDILLVDSFANESLSHGFIRYKINQTKDIPLGSRIENTASIFFDFNEAIVTNTVFHTVNENFLEISTSTPRYNRNRELHIYPNPANDLIKINLPKNILNTLTSVEIRDISGKLRYQSKENENLIDISISTFDNGIYFINLYTENGQSYIGKFSVIK